MQEKIKVLKCIETLQKHPLFDDELFSIEEHFETQLTDLMSSKVLGEINCRYNAKKNQAGVDYNNDVILKFGNEADKADIVIFPINASAIEGLDNQEFVKLAILSKKYPNKPQDSHTYSFYIVKVHDQYMLEALEVRNDVRYMIGSMVEINDSDIKNIVSLKSSLASKVGVF